jgi:hypothetical protein
MQRKKGERILDIVIINLANNICYFNLKCEKPYVIRQKEDKHKQNVDI